MSKLRPGKLIQIIDGRWYHCKKVEMSECCTCGILHKVYTKIKDGKVYQKWQQVVR